jgi:hypothetical protein
MVEAQQRAECNPDKEIMLQVHMSFTGGGMQCRYAQFALIGLKIQRGQIA